ncbi:MAG: thiamine-phosphate kinase [Candidatus Hodarchaeales archaeon]|jgi:thiamine-monophosphate kinase
MRTLKDIKELDIIQLLQAYLVSSPVMGSNEDAYLIRDQQPYVLINIDSMQRDGDFLPNQSWTQIGGKLVTMTFSDLVAKGASPEKFLSALVLENKMSEENLKELASGIQQATFAYNASYLGGDLGSASETVLTGIGIGTIKQGKILTRRNAQEGDLVCVTGYFGLTAIAFDYLLNTIKYKSQTISSRLLESAINKVYDPELRLQEGIILCSSELASASIDSSDGLASALNWLSKESNIRIIVDHLPIEPALLEYNFSDELIQDMTLFGGEEFELVFTIPSSKLDQTLDVFKRNNNKCIIIGKCCSGEGVFYRKNNEDVRIPLYGWDSIQQNHK